MKKIDRQFKQQYHSSESYLSEDLYPIDRFFNCPALILIGDPGSGKTTEFKYASKKEKNSVYVSIRDFLALDAKKRWAGKTLYLDGLDEHRAKSGDGGTALDEIRKKLDELGLPKFRLSCRSDDWYGDSDVASLRFVSPDDSICVISIESLSEDNIHEILQSTIPDHVTFIDDAKSHDIFELLSNPQTLEMIIDVYQKEGKLPTSKSETYLKTCEILIQEFNEQHSRSSNYYTIDDLFQASGFLCAIQLLSNLEGFAFSRSNTDHSHELLPSYEGDHVIVKLAGRTRLFISSGPEKFKPAHRTVAEFLAASFFSSKINKGFSISRIQALITGNDGGTLSELKGLFGWLTCLNDEIASLLIPTDPFSVIMHGDISKLNVSLKKSILKALADLASRNPWFRANNFSSHPFSGFATPDMEDYLVTLLENDSYHPVFISCILDAIKTGSNSLNVGPELLTIIRDNQRSGFIRYDALQAYDNNCQNPENELLKILHEIHDGKLIDSDQRFRGYLLKKLYPSFISVNNILDYITKWEGSFIGEYYFFLTKGLVNNTDKENIPLLIQEVIDRKNPKTDDHPYKDLLSSLLIKGLREFGVQIELSVLWEWLGIVVNKYGSVGIDREESLIIRQWLNEHQSIILSIFEYWVSITENDQLLKKDHYFWQRLHRVNYPENFCKWLFDKVFLEPNGHLSDYFFRLSLQQLTIHNREDALPVDVFINFSVTHSKFKSILDEELSWKIPDWRVNEAIRIYEIRIKDKETKEKNIEWFIKNLRTLKKGTNLNGLHYVSNLYYGNFTDSDKNISGFERIIKSTNLEIAEAAQEGFENLLLSFKIEEPKSIGKSASNNKKLVVGIIVLAAMDIVVNNSEVKLKMLPVSTIASAFCFHYTNYTDEKDKRVWPYLIIKYFPELSIKALQELWHPQLKKKIQHIEGLYDLTADDKLKPIANQLVFPVLSEFSNLSEQYLRSLLSFSLSNCEKQKLIDLVEKVITKRGFVKNQQRILWFAAGFIVSLGAFKTRLKSYLKNSKDKIYYFIQCLKIFIDDLKITIDSESLMFIISLSGERFAPDRTLPRGTVSINYEASQAISSFIDKISSSASNESTECLKIMCDNKMLMAWHDKLNYALDTHLQIKRDSLFSYPSTTEIIETLQGGRPSNVSDLQAIVLESLILVKNEIQNGQTDAYKAFWNKLDQWSRITGDSTARPEEYCRDRILDILGPKLSAKQIIAEKEGQYADSKRADIKILYQQMNLPIEIKRHYHPDVWSAPIDQLKKQYTRDPHSGGRGIYLVLWFGVDYKPCPGPPPGTKNPLSSDEMVSALNQILGRSNQVYMKVLVIDVSRTRLTESD